MNWFVLPEGGTDQAPLGVMQNPDPFSSLQAWGIGSDLKVSLFKVAIMLCMQNRLPELGMCVLDLNSANWESFPIFHTQKPNSF